MGLFFKSKEEKEQLQKEKKLKYEKSIFFHGITLQPIGKIAQNKGIGLTLIPEKSCLNIHHDDIDITLPYERIISFSVNSEVSLAASGSTIGRALVGGALLGDTGATVGAMSGKGNTKTRWIGTLLYKDKEGNIQELHFLETKFMGLYDRETKSLFARKFELAVNKIASQYAEDITEL